MTAGRIGMSGAILIVSGIVALAMAQEHRTEAAPQHVVLTPDQLKWSDQMPPGLPAGGQMAVLEGDPAKGAFTVRLKAPANFVIKPHFHSAGEHITVIEGTFYVGSGDTFEKTKATALPAGGFTAMPAGMRHFAFNDQPCVIQIHSDGPFDITYVNAADDPRAAGTK